MKNIESAAKALDSFDASPVIQDAAAIADAFDAAGIRIAQSLEKAAERGELSFNGLAESVLNDLAKLAVSEIVEAPLNALIDGLGRSLGGLGGGSSTTVNLNLSGASDPDAFRRSEGQIAGSLARAVSLGQGRI